MTELSTDHFTPTAIYRIGLDALEVIGWELEKLRALKEHELGVSLEYDRDGGFYYVPNVEE